MRIAPIHLRVAALWSIVFLAFVWTLGASQYAAACERKVIRDYLAPLKGMPPIQEPPASGKAPFAPGGVKIEVQGGGLIAGRGSVGYSLSNDGDRSRHLNWIVETQLLKVNRKGKVVAKLGVRRHGVPSVQAGLSRDFIRWVPSGHALYRMDIRFLDKEDHRALGAYSTYVRAVPERAELRLKIDTPSVLPGQFAYATLVNSGTVPVEFNSQNFGFRVSAFTGERWIPVPHNPPLRERKHLRRVSYLSAGTEARGCVRYLVPNGQAPGLFRFSTLWAYEENAALAEALFQVIAP